MSYILDALKRSEQERHQDKVADLSQDLLILQKKQQKRSVWPLVIAGLLIVNLTVLIFFFYESGESTSITAAEEDIRIDVNTQNERVNDNIDSNDSVKASQRLDNKPLVKSIPKHVQKKVITERVASQNSEVEISPKVKERGVFTEDGFELIAPKNTAKDVLAKLESSSVVESSLAEPEPQFELIRPKGASVKLSDNEDLEGTIVEKESVEGYFESVPHLTDLSLGFQKSIPDLVFNSHIYSGNPSARRVMINNLYMREGDAFSGMTIKSIGEQYLHLEKNGSSFKLPVLRDWVSP